MRREKRALWWGATILATLALACGSAEPDLVEAPAADEERVEASAAPDVQPKSPGDPREAEEPDARAETLAPLCSEEAPGDRGDDTMARTHAAAPPDATARSSAEPGETVTPEPAPTEEPSAGADVPPAEASLDLKALEKKLRDTRALGVFTKLALKNDLDDFVDDVRSFHSKRVGELDQLRERFELLLMKVLSLLQDKERDLADEIARSRDALWTLLSDPREFARLENM